MLRRIIDRKTIIWEIEMGIAVEREIKEAGGVFNNLIKNKFTYLQNLQETGKIEQEINITLLDSFILISLEDLLNALKYNEKHKTPQIYLCDKSYYSCREDYLVMKYNARTLEIIYSGCGIDSRRLKNFWLKDETNAS